MSDAKRPVNAPLAAEQEAAIPPPPGAVFVVSAPSGAGKTSLVRALLEQDPRIKLSISHTTRARRAGEQEGVHYHFVDRDQFDRLRAEGAFLECAEVHGNAYGTARESVIDRTVGGNDVLLEIDWQGAEQVRESIANCISIFVFPPSMVQLRARLEQRGTETREVIQTRLRNAMEEIAHSDQFDYWVVNEDFGVALQELAAIVGGERQKRARRDPKMQHWVDKLIAESSQMAV